jgi:hypothetical protein
MISNQSLFRTLSVLTVAFFVIGLMLTANAQELPPTEQPQQEGESVVDAVQADENLTIFADLLELSYMDQVLMQ